MRWGTAAWEWAERLRDAAGFRSLVALWLLEEKSEETAVMMVERFGAAGI